MNENVLCPDPRPSDNAWPGTIRRNPGSNPSSHPHRIPVAGRKRKGDTNKRDKDVRERPRIHRLKPGERPTSGLFERRVIDCPDCVRWALQKDMFFGLKVEPISMYRTSVALARRGSEIEDRRRQSQGLPMIAGFR